MGKTCSWLFPLLQKHLPNCNGQGFTFAFWTQWSGSSGDKPPYSGTVLLITLSSWSTCEHCLQDCSEQLHKWVTSWIVESFTDSPSKYASINLEFCEFILRNSEVSSEFLSFYPTQTPISSVPSLSFPPSFCFLSVTESQESGLWRTLLHLVHWFQQNPLSF